jgi:hypothetical protein
MPPLVGGVAPTSALDSAGRGDVGPGPSPDLAGQIGKVREASDAFMTLLKATPALQAEQQAFQKLVRQVLQKLAQAAQTSSPSSQAIPMGG